MEAEKGRRARGTVNQKAAAAASVALLGSLKMGKMERGEKRSRAVAAALEV